MNLGSYYWSHPAPARRAVREMWFRAALAARPESITAWTMLGLALWDKGDLDGATAALREAIRLNPQEPRLHNDLGYLLWDQGDLEQAIVAFREAMRLQKSDPRIRNALGLALRATGDLAGAVEIFQGAIRDIPRPQFIQTVQAQDLSLSAYYLRQTKRWQELLPRLPVVAADQDELKNPAETVELAKLCGQPFLKRYVLAVRLYAKAFAVDPKLADNLTAAHRYDAARYAALAAAGKDAEGTNLGVEEWRHLTGLAFEWLRADLAAWQDKAKDLEERALVRSVLRGWKQIPNQEVRLQFNSALAELKADPNNPLGSVRDPEWLAAMPEADRRRWETFWADVDTLLATIDRPMNQSPLRK